MPRLRRKRGAVQRNDDEMNVGQVFTAIYVVATLVAMLVGAVKAFGFVAVLFTSIAMYLAVTLAIRIRFRVFLALAVAVGCGILGHLVARALAQGDDVVFTLTAISFVVAGLWRPATSQSPPSLKAPADTVSANLTPSPIPTPSLSPSPSQEPRPPTQPECSRQPTADAWHRSWASTAPLERARTFELHPHRPSRLRPVLWAIFAIATVVGFAAWLVKT